MPWVETNDWYFVDTTVNGVTQMVDAHGNCWIRPVYKWDPEEPKEEL